MLTQKSLPAPIIREMWSSHILSPGWYRREKCQHSIGFSLYCLEWGWLYGCACVLGFRAWASEGHKATGKCNVGLLQGSD